MSDFDSKFKEAMMWAGAPFIIGSHIIVGTVEGTVEMAKAGARAGAGLVQRVGRATANGAAYVYENHLREPDPRVGGRGHPPTRILAGKEIPISGDHERIETARKIADNIVSIKSAIRSAFEAKSLEEWAFETRPEGLAVIIGTEVGAEKRVRTRDESVLRNTRKSAKEDPKSYKVMYTVGVSATILITRKAILTKDPKEAARPITSARPYDEGPSESAVVALFTKYLVTKYDRGAVTGNPSRHFYLGGGEIIAGVTRVYTIPVPKTPEERAALELLQKEDDVYEDLVAKDEAGKDVIVVSPEVIHKHHSSAILDAIAPRHSDIELVMRIHKAEEQAAELAEKKRKARMRALFTRKEPSKAGKASATKKKKIVRDPKPTRPDPKTAAFEAAAKRASQKKAEEAAAAAAPTRIEGLVDYSDTDEDTMDTSAAFRKLRI